ncbi:MAG: ABC transporter ATP-binding protein [Chloroflexia bacterium]|nr:ABC transporter ATP-binding protein [Chloroflexia bacterium]
MAILQISDFDVSYVTKRRPPFQAVKNANLTIGEGEIVGLVGESGSGKSTLGNAAIRLLDPPGTITRGTTVFMGTDITRMTEDQLRAIRWKELATVFQSSMNSLNPVINIEKQFIDTIQAHTRQSDAEARRRAEEVLEVVNIEPTFLKFFPHELSGGMKQRVALALSLVLEPKFLLLDEPTTGLDVVVQQTILDNLKIAQRHYQFAVLMISHDLGAIMEIADRVVVMYEGELVDDQPAQQLLQSPKHPYSKMLLDSYKLLWVTPDELDPNAGTKKIGDVSGASAIVPPDRTQSVVLTVRNLNKTFSRRRGFKTTTVDAVKDVSFQLERGRITALVGQSGSGKSTIARLITGIEHPTSGSIMFGATDVATLRGKSLKEYRAHIQMVFQDPYSALNPAHTILHSLMRPLQNYKRMSAAQARARAVEMLEQVGLTPATRFMDKNPHQLSGGQRQRVVVARALAPDPEIIIADEPTSMLDVSIRAEILEVLNRLVRDTDIAMLFVTHDLLSARLLADEIMVLNQGRVVESGKAEEIIANPQDPYTKLLLSSIPNPFVELGTTAAD